MKKQFIAVFILAASLGLPALSQTPVYLDETKPLEERVKDALSRMTLEEKVKMCHAQSKFSSPGVPRLGIPEIWMSDGPHGVREEIQWNSWNVASWTNDSCTAFPALTCLAATWNPDMSALYGKAISEEARYREKDVLLGPGVNIYRTPLNGRNFEYMGEDPYLASVMVVPYIQGVQKNGVAACVKHYALNNQELWRGHINVELSDRALHEIYLPAFKAAVMQGHVWSIMGSYNKVRGQHACHNELLLQRILKKDWKFDGVVITDWGGAHDTREAALNGLDIEMGSYTNGLTSESAFTYVPTVEGPNHIKLHNSQYNTPDRIVASLTTHDKSGNHYSFIYEGWRGGANYSYMMVNDINSDGYNYDAIYVPTDKEVADNQFRFVTEGDKTRFMDYVHANSYLKNQQGKYAEAYSLYSPWVHRIDFSWKHDFVVNAGKDMHKLQLSFDIRNVMNLFNSKWGVAKYLNPAIGSEARILKYEGVDADGVATFSTPAAINGDTKTFTPSISLGQCWYASIGIKYIFN